MTLKAGEFSTRGTLRQPRPSARQLNTRQYRFAFSELNTGVTSLANYQLIEQAGKAFGLNGASDSNAVAIVHVNEPGNPVYITPGTAKDIPEGFDRLYLERPTQPFVPSRTDLFYIFDLSDRVGGVQYGPLSPAALSKGADNYAATGLVAVAVLESAATPPQAVFAAVPGRRIVTIRNESPGIETVWVTLDATTVGQDKTTGGVIEALEPGREVTIPYTGAVSVFASAATAKIRAYSFN